jgi:hypothetical protein
MWVRRGWSMRYRRAPASDRSLASDHLDNLACFPGLGPSGRLPEAYPGYASLPRPQYLHLIVLDRGGVAGGPVHQLSLVARKLVFSYVRALPVTPALMTQTKANSFGCRRSVFLHICSTTSI